MSADIVIEAHGLGKRYALGEGVDLTRNFREMLVDLPRQTARLFRRGIRPASGHGPRDLWALEDLNFEIRQGEAVGIIGRNGAGKSTLLKILSRITWPTTGEVRIRGRIGSLLEVGTGFHPELTGRENIYLNGVILGMTRAEIDRKFDEIVDFSGVEKFLDTPVKRYSSGMRVRLAFGIAAQLEPEILIVDEVLAVGDQEFQKKCLGKMEEITGQDRTVLFVSHNMAAVRNLCTKGILLHDGRITAQGDLQPVVTNYLEALSRFQAQDREHLAINETMGVRLKSIELRGDSGRPLSSLVSGECGTIALRLESTRPLPKMLVSISLETKDDVRLCILHSGFAGAQLALDSPGGTIECRIPRLPMFPGNYWLSIKVMTGVEEVFWLPYFYELEVTAGDFYGTGRLPPASWAGLTLVDHLWGTASLDAY